MKKEGCLVVSIGMVALLDAYMLKHGYLNYDELLADLIKKKLKTLEIKT